MKCFWFSWAFTWRFTCTWLDLTWPWPTGLHGLPPLAHGDSKCGMCSNNSFDSWRQHYLIRFVLTSDWKMLDMYIYISTCLKWLTETRVLTGRDRCQRHHLWSSGCITGSLHLCLDWWGCLGAWLWLRSWPRLSTWMSCNVLQSLA